MDRKEEALQSHLLLDGFGRMFPQGQLGCVGQSLLHCQITQQVITLERNETKRLRMERAKQNKKWVRCREVEKYLRFFMLILDILCRPCISCSHVFTYLRGELQHTDTVWSPLSSFSAFQLIKLQYILKLYVIYGIKFAVNILASHFLQRSVHFRVVMHSICAAHPCKMCIFI